MSRLSLGLLGPFYASIDGQSLERFRTNKVQALLVYLATESDAQKRESLITLLWPGLPERSARANLRQILYLLRQTIPELSHGLEFTKGPSNSESGSSVPLIITNRHSIQLNPVADVAVDVRQFENHLNRTQRHDHIDLFTCHRCRKDLKEVASLYRGNFLADFYLNDSAEFEDWAQSRREYFRRRALDALETLTTITARQKSYSEAQSYAERQLEIDELRESAYRQLMEVLSLNGRREQALAQYESCKRVLAEELGMAPTARTTKIYEKILAGDLTFDVSLAQGVRGYELKDEIGEGAYGTIHRAIQPSIGREVAVKVILRKYANNPDFIRRFEAEAQTIAHLEHPYIVPLYDYWRDPDGAYLVMRHLRGGNLLQALESGPWHVEQASKMVDQIASALSAAHRQGVVHRDIKPANILLDEAGNAYLSDFGIAKDLTGEMQITAEGAVIGTPDYISPEQITGGVISPETDIYSLGLVIYETLTGERPFPDTSVANLIYKHLHEPVPLVQSSRPDVQSEVDEVIQRATAKQPSDRFSDALELAEALREAIRGQGLDISGEFPLGVSAISEIYNPYKGLRSFQEADADDFFGRDSLIRQLLDRLDLPADGRFLALVGPSGSGKSSVVKAGLIPALRAGAISGSEKWFVTEMVPGTHPLEELELALWPVAVDPPPSLVAPMARDTRGMLRTLRRILPSEYGAQLLLVIDQFEEIFTLVEDEERREFFLDSLLAAIQAPRSPLRVVVTLRADFYDRPLQIQTLGQMLKENTEIILPLSPEELTWAVREPARRMGVGLESGLAEAVVADVADQPGALPLLQYAMTELFDSRQDNLMKKGTYDKIGGVAGALTRRAEDIYAELDEQGQEATRQLFLRLVTLGEGVEDTRRRVLRKELEAVQWPNGSYQLPSVGTVRSDNVIDQFGNARLLSFDYDPVTRGPTVEVAHEALLREWPRLREWLDDSRTGVRFQRMLATAAAEWVASNRDAGFLLRDSRLDQFAGWAAESNLALTGDENAFLEASITARNVRLADEEARIQRELETAQQLAKAERARAEEQTQAASRLRRRAIFMGGALFVAALLAIAAVFFAQQSNENATIAENNAIKAQEFADLAAARAAEAQTEANIRATAEAVALEEQQSAEAEQKEADRQRDIAEDALVEAESQRNLTRSRELASLAINAMETDPQLGLLLGLEAISVADTRQARSALHEVIPNARLLLAMDDIPGSIIKANISQDGQRIAATTTDGIIQIRDANSGDILQTISFDDGLSPYFAFNPDGSRLATVNWQGSGIIVDSPFSEPQPDGISIWDLDSGEELLKITEEILLEAVAWSPDGQRLAAIARMGGQPDVIIWNAESGDKLLTITGDEEGPRDYRADQNLIYSPDSTLLATTSHLGNVYIYDALSGELVTILAHEISSPLKSLQQVAFSPSGDKLAVNSFDGEFFMWDLATETLDYRLKIGRDSGSSPFSPNGSMIITGSETGASIRDTATGDSLIDLPLPAYGPLGFNFSPDGERMLSANGRRVTIWDLTPDYEVRTLTLPAAIEKTGSKLSPDGRRLVTMDVSGEVSSWDALTGDLLWRAKGHDDFTIAVDFSPNGQHVATGSDDGTIVIWDLGTGDQLLKWQAQGEWVNRLKYSPDGSFLASANEDGTARIFDAADGSLIRTITIENGIWGFDIDASGERVALSTWDPPSMATVWDINSGEKIFELAGPESGTGIIKLVFDPENRWLAGSDRSGFVQIWDMINGELLHSIQTRHISSLPTLGVSSDGNRLASVGIDGMAQIWDPMAGQLLLEFPLPDAGTRVEFTPDDRHIWVSGREQEWYFTLDSEELVSLAEERLIRNWTVEECKQYNIESCPAE